MSSSAQKKAEGSGEKEARASDPSAHQSKQSLNFEMILGNKQIHFGTTNFTFDAEAHGGCSYCD